MEESQNNPPRLIGLNSKNALPLPVFIFLNLLLIFFIPMLGCGCHFSTPIAILELLAIVFNICYLVSYKSIADKLTAWTLIVIWVTLGINSNSSYLNIEYHIF
ncbi:MAG: hypothetical protein COA79_22010 [Planctomycetota bacterium]|nr:MAG: hypothetical protein COA79_22010 [Planctomycetota bacterium]